MNHEGELNVDLTRDGISPDAVKATLQADARADDHLAVPRNEEITRKIRSPLPPPVVPPAENQPEASTENEVTPCVAPVIEMSMDVSKNLHPQDLLPPPTQDLGPASKPAAKPADRSSARPAKVRHKGLIVVAVIVIAGTSIDVALWLTSGTRPAKSERSAETTAPANPGAGGDPVAGMSRAPNTLPKVEPLPEDDHGRVMDKAGASESNSDVAKDKHAHAIKGSPSALFPVPERANSTAPPAEVTGRAKRDGKFKLAPRGGDDFGVDLRSNKTRRTTTTIDESNPYAP